MRLSICMITRNAERQIERALQSVSGLGAEVIVGDTGSTDQTVTRAQAQGARVTVIAWEDDFGVAQNQALVRATGEWVFWLNPDEELLPEGEAQISDFLDRPDTLAYLVRLEHLAKADQPGTETLQPRLFRRLPEIRFLGRLHPHFDPPLEELARRENMYIRTSELRLRHHAYLSVVTEDKLRWATRLLELELSDRPGQLHYLIEYGRNLLRLNDPRGHVVLAEAAEIVLACAGAASAPFETVASLLEYLLTVSAAQSRSRLAPAQARQLALRWFPASPPLLWALAERSFRAGDFQDAAGLLEQLIHLGRTKTYSRAAPFDPAIMEDPALLNLARCYLRLGDLDKAEARLVQVTAPNLQTQAQEEKRLLEQLRRRSIGS